MLRRKIASDGTSVLVHEHSAAPSSDRVDRLTNKIGGPFPEEVFVTEYGASPARDRVKGLDDSILGTDPRSVDVRANVSGRCDVEALDKAIVGTHGRTITVTTIVKKVRKWFSKADGGIEHRGPGGGCHAYMADSGTIGSFAGK